MSRKKIVELDTEARTALAQNVKALRLQRKMTQEELARNAKVSRQTLGDIEKGVVAAPQQRTLQRIYEVLGVDIEPVTFDAQTDLWLGMLGTLIEAVPQASRQRAVDGAIRAISNELHAPSNVVAFPARPTAEDGIEYIGRLTRDQMPAKIAADTKGRKADSEPAAE